MKNTDQLWDIQPNHYDASIGYVLNINKSII